MCEESTSSNNGTMVVLEGVEVKLLTDYNTKDPIYNLTCTFKYGAATTIDWMIDGIPECRNVTKELKDRTSSVYSSSVIVHGSVGSVTCSASNSKPSNATAGINFQNYEGKGCLMLL